MRSLAKPWEAAGHGVTSEIALPLVPVVPESREYGDDREHLNVVQEAWIDRYLPKSESI